MSQQHRVFSGIQPTGALHIGNYVGALRNWVRLQSELESFFCIVDYHAITIPYDPEEMPARVFEAAVDVLACGIDPERSTFFVQSRVPEHTELCWIFNTLTSVGALERMTQFKEKSEQFREGINAGLFNYPVLQTADILLYKADRVPVGEDQLQHLELSREIARRFNQRFGETFPEPEAVLTKAPRLMALNDPTRKMSKSIPGSYVSLSDDDATIRKKIGRAVTDAGLDSSQMSPGVKNLFTLLGEFGDEATVRQFQQAYDSGSLRYSELKPAVAEAVAAALAPIRARRDELAAHPEQVCTALETGAERAGAIARRTMDEVRQRLGLRA
ncbi:MAG TPA: tryptophan--tRNA ligase [Candidatus Polarisedimenticolia bacterium]|nr:tryptophan--tRNA ligase [Candidatus Polarisedimenticolia bacterium]